MKAFVLGCALLVSGCVANPLPQPDDGDVRPSDDAGACGALTDPCCAAEPFCQAGLICVPADPDATRFHCLQPLPR